MIIKGPYLKYLAYIGLNNFEFIFLIAMYNNVTL